MTCECGCGREAAPGGRLSWACYKQRRRKGSTRRTDTHKTVRHPEPRGAVFEAMRDVVENADAMDKADWHRAWSRFWQAVRRYRAKRNNVQKAPNHPE